MRKLSICLLIVVILSLCIPVSARDSSYGLGEVLYHQDFSVLHDVENSGITLGSLTAEGCYISTKGDPLDIVTNGNGRMYALLPKFSKNDTYTIDFTFRFTDVRAENGYIASILTCRGSEPTNISSVVIRANGTIDDFDELEPELAMAIANGETVNVKIPISRGVLHQVIIIYNKVEYIINRDSILVIGEGNVGFSARNASASVDEIYVVNGVDYYEMTGYYADESYASDLLPVIPPDDTDHSPETFDPLSAVLAALCISAAAALLLRKKIQN
ncbi:MAG: hypothetical protein E7672_05430 [Ruminococcaceae bacterium]|nr:hypothetical protein [Oscillospiraceae bacterium]